VPQFLCCDLKSQVWQACGATGSLVCVVCSTHVEIVRVSGRDGDAQRVDTAAGVELDEQEAVSVQIEQCAHVFDQTGAFSRSQKEFVNRFLAARGIGTRELERRAQSARFAKVTGWHAAIVWPGWHARTCGKLAGKTWLGLDAC
jgi:hypothetical protein